MRGLGQLRPPPCRLARRRRRDLGRLVVHGPSGERHRCPRHREHGLRLAHRRVHRAVGGRRAGGRLTSSPALSSDCRRSVALGLSLLRRAREIVTGVPSLIIWQCLEPWRLWRNRGRSPLGALSQAADSVETQLTRPAARADDWRRARQARWRRCRAPIEPGELVHALGLVLVDEDVGQHQGAHLEAAVEEPARRRGSCKTWLPKPPTAPSSTVTRTSCSRASRRISSSSSGLAKRASATVADSPKAASCSAALRHSGKRVPSDNSATAEPSRRMRPLPIASGTTLLGQRRRRCLPRAGSGRRKAGRRSPPRSPPCGRARPRRPPP